MAGIYIHVPFCTKRCLYCDFFSTTNLQLRNRYVEAVLTEIRCRQTEWQNHAPFTTLYFGGGTPSLLTINELEKIINALPANSLEEVTLEANPDDINKDYCRQLLALGFNRLSIGVQTFDDTSLSLLGRRHNANQAIQAVLDAHAAGFKNLSIDLMYALPNQTLARWKNDLVFALQLPVQHISTYCLTLEPNTQLYKQFNQGLYPSPDEELSNAMFDASCEILTKGGFIHYEVSNFCLKNNHSHHNSNYWNGTPYIGLGAAAHSYDGTARSWNIAHLETYLQQASKHFFQPQREILTDDQKRMERVMLGLRTNKGIPMTDISNRRKMDDFIQQGYLYIDNQQVIATRQGLHILNFLIQNLI